MSTILRPLPRTSNIHSIFQAGRSHPFVCQSCRNARLLKRPKRPYTFSQLVTLSDGSAFTLRTTSPLAVYRSTRDTRNSVFWNPSSKELLNVEDDEAGRLAGFRARFGRGYDSNAEPTPSTDSQTSLPGDTKAEASSEKKIGPNDDGFGQEEDEDLLELISSFGQAEEVHRHSKKKSK